MTSDAPLATEAVAAALDEAGAYRLAGDIDDRARRGHRRSGRTLPLA